MMLNEEIYGKLEWIWSFLISCLFEGKWNGGEIRKILYGYVMFKDFNFLMKFFFEFFFYEERNEGDIFFSFDMLLKIKVS